MLYFISLAKDIIKERTFTTIPTKENPRVMSSTTLLGNLFPEKFHFILDCLKVSKEMYNVVASYQYGVPIKESLFCLVRVFLAETPKSASLTSPSIVRSTLPAFKSR